MPLPVTNTQNRWAHLAPRHFMHDGELGFLLTKLDEIQPQWVIEMGVNEGITAYAILIHIKSIKHYVGIDVPFGHKTPLAAQKVEVSRSPGLLVRDDRRFELYLRYNGSLESIVFEDNSFDVAFIDGDHSYSGVMEDYKLARRVVRPGGWIFFHDYNNATCEVTQALDDLSVKEHRNIYNEAGTWMAYEQV